MPYMINYNSTTDDLYVYSNSATVWPTYNGAGVIGENSNLPLKNQIAYYQGVGITYNVDFSGVEGGIYRQLGQAYYCPNCFSSLNYPYCNTFWNSSIMGGQGGGSSNHCVQFDGSWVEWGSENTQPYKTIDPTIQDANDNYVNARFWNDVNLWRTATFQGNVLLDCEDNEAETYIWTLGHPISTSPCDYPRQFSFFDRTNNTVITRYFVCPCVEWNLPQSGEYPEGLQCLNCCAGKYSYFTSFGNSDIPPASTTDGSRLWVMMKTDPNGIQQQPIPSTIKRYKVLVGSIRKDWPFFGLDSNFKFIRAKTDKVSNKIIRDRDTTKWGNIPITTWSLDSTLPETVNINSGEGDDGAYPAFTISDTGEQIIVAFTSSESWSYKVPEEFKYYNRPLTSGVPTPCISGQIFIKTGDTVKFNTYCAPAIFHPELVIPNYPNVGQNLELNFDNGTNLIDLVRLNNINSLLEELGKPKILTYTFPECRTPSTTYFPDDFEEVQKKYPLYKSPYFSRQSKNTFFENTNHVAFNEKKMLQASELNELQEKFYEKESLKIHYIHNWFTKQHINQQTDDVFGFSEYSNSLIGATGPDTLRKTFKPWLCSKAIPFEKGKIRLGSAATDNPQLVQIRLEPCKLMLNSVFYETSAYPFLLDNFPANFDKKYNNIDYIKINSNIFGEVDLSKITETSINAITLKMDINNLISCNEYQELKDNSSADINEFSPCGADRNYLSPILPSVGTDLTIIQQTIEKTPNFGIFNLIDTFDNKIISLSTPFNQIGYPGYVLYLLAFAKKENGVINFYYANGIKIDDI